MRAGTAGKYAVAVIAVAAGVLAWLFLAPSNLGGSTEYVVITGDSMEPLLHADDLAVVREKEHYEVGDVAAYESDKIGQLVLHRIVEREGDRFVFQGDNNDFLDPEKPTEARLGGELWGHIPRAGIVFRLARTPVGIAIGGVIIVTMLGLFSSKKKRKTRSGRRSARRRTAPTAVPSDSGTTVSALPRAPGPPPPPPRKETPSPFDERPSHAGGRRIAQVIASLSAAAVLAFALLGAMAATRPATVAGTQDVPFEHSGAFSYSAPTGGSPAYDGPVVTTGEPVFLRVIDELTLTFDYRFISEAPHDVTTAGSMTVRLGADNGLRRTIILPTATGEGDDELTLSATLDLDDLTALARQVRQATGIDQTTYTLTIAPTIDVSGTIAGQELDEPFTPELDLEFDGLQIRTSSVEEGEENPALAPTTRGSVTNASRSAYHITLLGRSASIPSVERIALIGGGAAFLVLIAMLATLMLSRPGDEPSRIEARYGSSLIPVSDAPLHVDTVEVRDFATLMRLAEQFEQAILHEQSGGVHGYMIPHDGILYRYRASEARPEATRKASRSQLTKPKADRDGRLAPPKPPPPAPKQDHGT